jgi:hypothetical protein
MVTISKDLVAVIRLIVDLGGALKFEVFSLRTTPAMVGSGWRCESCEIGLNWLCAQVERECRRTVGASGSGVEGVRFAQRLPSINTYRDLGKKPGQILENCFKGKMLGNVNG